MKLTVLVDNNTLIDRYFLAEPGLSFLIEDNGYRLLFDTGYSDIFIKNAIKMGKDLHHLNAVLLSHSHLDHTWGLEPLIRYYSELEIEKHLVSRPKLVAHPMALTSATADGFKEFGMLLSQKQLAKHFSLQLDIASIALTDRLIFLGQIPRKHDFEGKLTFGRKDGSAKADTVPEDSALVCRTDKGLVIVTGCSHAGICNIVSHAMDICNDDRIVDIIGGFHLQQPSPEHLEGTISFLSNLQPLTVHACHCTDLDSKIALAGVVNLREVGVGLALDYN